MDPGHKASKNPSENADLGFQAIGLALRIMQLNVEGLSAAKRHLSGERLRCDDVNLIPISTPHMFTDDAEATDGYVWLTEGNNIIASEVPSGV